MQIMKGLGSLYAGEAVLLEASAGQQMVAPHMTEHDGGQHQELDLALGAGGILEHVLTPQLQMMMGAMEERCSAVRKDELEGSCAQKLSLTYPPREALQSGLLRVFGAVKQVPNCSLQEAMRPGSLGSSGAGTCSVCVGARLTAAKADITRSDPAGTFVGYICLLSSCM